MPFWLSRPTFNGVLSPPALKRAKDCAKATGDLARLSDVDLDVLALALPEAVLVTDDYRLQNAYQHAGGAVEPVANAPSKHVWIWEQRCTGCGATFLPSDVLAPNKVNSAIAMCVVRRWSSSVAARDSLVFIR